jgi:hypothetical protein
LLEKSVEDALVAGVKCHKPAFTMKGERLGKGWPDRIVFAWKGRIAFIELKRPDVGRKGLKRRQSVIGGMLRLLGFDVYCLWTKEQVEKWLVEFFGD